MEQVVLEWSKVSKFISSSCSGSNTIDVTYWERHFSSLFSDSPPPPLDTHFRQIFLHHFSRLCHSQNLVSFTPYANLSPAILYKAICSATHQISLFLIEPSIGTSHLFYADDILLLSDNLQSLQAAVNSLYARFF